MSTQQSPVSVSLLFSHLYPPVSFCLSFLPTCLLVYKPTCLSTSLAFGSLVIFFICKHLSTTTITEHTCMHTHTQHTRRNTHTRTWRERERKRERRIHTHAHTSFQWKFSVSSTISANLFRITLQENFCSFNFVKAIKHLKVLPRIFCLLFFFFWGGGGGLMLLNQDQRQAASIRGVLLLLFCFFKVGPVSLLSLIGRAALEPNWNEVESMERQKKNSLTPPRECWTVSGHVESWEWDRAVGWSVIGLAPEQGWVTARLDAV